MCLTLPRTLITIMGIEKVLPVVHGPGSVPAAAAALVDRRADEPLHLDVDRRDARRRAARVPPRAARQRPHRDPRRPGRPAGPALHPLLGLPERLPGLRARRRARLRLGLPGPDRRGPDPATGRRRARRDAAVRFHALRRVLRRLPGEDQHPGGTDAPARPGRGTRAPGRRRSGGRGDGGRRCVFSSPRLLRAVQWLAARGGRRLPGTASSGGCPRPAAPGRPAGTCRFPRHRPSAPGGASRRPHSRRPVSGRPLSGRPSGDRARGDPGAHPSRARGRRA